MQRSTHNEVKEKKTSSSRKEFDTVVVQCCWCSEMMRTGALYLHSNGGWGGWRKIRRASWKDNRVHYVDDFQGKIAFPICRCTATEKVAILSYSHIWMVLYCYYHLSATTEIARLCISQSLVRHTYKTDKTTYNSLFTCCAVLCCWTVCGHNNLCANNYDSVCVTRAASSSVSDGGKRISQIVCCAPLV